MKYRIEIVKDILEYLYNAESPFSESSQLYKEFKNIFKKHNTNIDNEKIIDGNYYNYINFFIDSYIIKATHNSEIKIDFDQNIYLAPELYYLTYNGQQVLESLMDENIWKKVKKAGSENYYIIDKNNFIRRF